MNYKIVAVGVIAVLIGIVGIVMFAGSSANDAGGGGMFGPRSGSAYKSGQMSMGPTGPTGAAGTPGGPTGPQGMMGPQGLMGERGPQGNQGPMGDRGDRGVPGPIGDRGLQGEVGPRGPTGADGVRGPTGYTGADGARGPTGADGVRGHTGHTGPVGYFDPDASITSLIASGNINASGNISATGNITSTYGTVKGKGVISTGNIDIEGSGFYQFKRNDASTGADRGFNFINQDGKMRAAMGPLAGNAGIGFHTYDTNGWWQSTPLSITRNGITTNVLTSNDINSYGNLAVTGAISAGGNILGNSIIASGDVDGNVFTTNSSLGGYAYKDRSNLAAGRKFISYANGGKLIVDDIGLAKMTEIDSNTGNFSIGFEKPDAKICIRDQCIGVNDLRVLAGISDLTPGVITLKIGSSLRTLSRPLGLSCLRSAWSYNGNPVRDDWGRKALYMIAFGLTPHSPTCNVNWEGDGAGGAPRTVTCLYSRIGEGEVGGKAGDVFLETTGNIDMVKVPPGMFITFYDRAPTADTLSGVTLTEGTYYNIGTVATGDTDSGRFLIIYGNIKYLGLVTSLNTKVAIDNYATDASKLIMRVPAGTTDYTPITTGVTTLDSYMKFRNPRSNPYNSSTEYTFNTNDLVKYETYVNSVGMTNGFTEVGLSKDSINKAIFYGKLVEIGGKSVNSNQTLNVRFDAVQFIMNDGKATRIINRKSLANSTDQNTDISWNNTYLGSTMIPPTYYTNTTFTPSLNPIIGYLSAYNVTKISSYPSN